MNKNLHKALALIILTALSTILTACGSDNDDYERRRKERHDMKLVTAYLASKREYNQKAVDTYYRGHLTGAILSLAKSVKEDQWSSWNDVEDVKKDHDHFCNGTKNGYRPALESLSPWQLDRTLKTIVSQPNIGTTQIRDLTMAYFYNLVPRPERPMTQSALGSQELYEKDVKFEETQALVYQLCTPMKEKITGVTGKEDDPMGPPTEEEQKFLDLVDKVDAYMAKWHELEKNHKEDNYDQINKLVGAEMASTDEGVWLINFIQSMNLDQTEKLLLQAMRTADRINSKKERRSSLSQ